MDEEVYGPERAERLVALLRALAERIQELDRTNGLLDAAPELQKLFGNARSELFHYEVRSTYDTPEIADNRRIVEELQVVAKLFVEGLRDIISAFLHQVPLVRCDDDALAGLLRGAGDCAILIRRPDRRIKNEHYDIGALDRALGEKHTDRLDL